MDVIKKYNLEPYKYDMLIARLEPENSIEIILDGVADANLSRPFLVIGNHETKDESNQIFDSELETFCFENDCKYIISFSNNAIRLKTEELMNKLGVSPFSIIHPSAIISDTAKVDLKPCDIK